MTMPPHKPWDPGETGGMDEPTWRRTVVGKVNEISSALANNTDATLAGNDAIEGVRKDVSKVDETLRPIAAAWAKAQKGFEVVGWFGTAAEWLFKKWIIVVAIGVAAKILISGGTWAEVMKLFKDIPP